MEEISDKELREKLLKFGIDVPVAANKEFLLKKLHKLETEAATLRRRSTPPAPSRANSDGPGSASKRSRLSLNESAIRQRQGSKEPELVPPAARGRQSLGAPSSRSGTPTTNTNNGNASARSRRDSSNSTSSNRSTRQSLSQQQANSRLNAVVEEGNHVNDNDKESEEEDDDDETQEDEEMDTTQEDDEGVELENGSALAASRSFGFGTPAKASSNSNRQQPEISSPPQHQQGNTSQSSSSTTNFNFGGKYPSRMSESVSTPPPPVPAGSSVTRRAVRKSTPAAFNSPAGAGASSPFGTSRMDESSTSSGSGDAAPSPRYQSYLEYFKRPLSDQPTSPLVFPRSQYASPAGSPFSTVATAGSPYRTSFNSSMDEDYSAGDDSDEENEKPAGGSTGGKLKFFSKMNPLNWIPRKWFTFTSGGGEEPGPDRQTDRSYNLGINNSRFPPSPPTSSAASNSRLYSTSSSSSPQSVNNGHWNSNRSSARLANQIYSPAQPPPVPPAMAAGRQAGFKAFFSRGERNGYGYSTGGPGTTDSSHLISKFLIVFVVLMFVSIGGYYTYKVNMLSQNAADGEKGSTLNSFFEGFMGKGDNVAAPPVQPKITSLVPPACGMEGYDSDACVPMSKIPNSRTLYDALKTELVDRARMKGCGSEVDDKITLASAKNLLFGLADLSKSEIEDAFQGMLMLVTENPAHGLKIEKGTSIDGLLDDNITIKDVKSLDFDTTKVFVEGVSPNFICVLFSGIVTLFCYCVIFVLLIMAGYGCYKLAIYYRGRKEREEKEMFDYVEKIINILHAHYEDSKDSGEDQFLAQNHVRDVLFSSRDRKKKEALWNKIVDHISSNESRVREEIQHLSGEEFRVWRFLPSASPLMTSKRFQQSPSSAPDSFLSSASSSPQPGSSPASGGGLYPNLSGLDSDNSVLGEGSLNSKWQGQAFEMTEGSPNSLPLIPTTCLKIRHMYDNDQDSGQQIEIKIERAIIEKCSQTRILHIGVDHDSRCVYVRCQTKDDAHLAYKSLHGWWFDGNLLSVRFLREDRYFTRFPQAKHRMVPLSTANLSSSPLSGQQFSNSVNRKC